MTLRIANACGFWGDDPDAPRRLVETAEIEYLTLEYLAELTMSILAHQRSKDPRAGFATDFLGAMRDVLPALKRQPQLRIVTNAGGVNPPACAKEIAQVLAAAGLNDVPIAVITGDDLLSQLPELQAAGIAFRHLDSGRPLSDLSAQVASANVYLGAVPIAEALDAGARIVITGRVADASLTVGPALHEFKWDESDWDKLAGATVAGHLIECGAQVTGGYSDRWREIDLVDIGYPIAELESDGSSVITKPLGSGGIVDRRSVVEQLVYEIGDPAAYFTPDVVADFTTVHVDEFATNRVRVRGASGKPRPDSYKVSLAYHAGFTASAQLLVWDRDPRAKAEFVGRLVFQRLARRGLTFARKHVEILGDGRDAREVIVRLAVQDSRREAVERFTREIAPLITNGPNGLAGYAAGRASVRPVLAYWPTTIPRASVSPKLDVRPAHAW